MNGLFQDLRFAYRMLVKNPGFTAVVVLAMGLGIGANTSIFTIVRGILLAPLPFPHAENIVSIRSAMPGDDRPGDLSLPDFMDIRARARSFESIGAWTESQAYLTLGTEPERFTSTVMTPSVLSVLGVKPALGRGFLPEEGVDGNQLTSVILSHRIWKDRLQSDPNVIGTTLRMNGRVRTVVGVMPEDFNFPETADFWIPLGIKAVEDGRGGHWLDVVGRLAKGSTPEQANAEATAIAGALAREYPSTNKGMKIAVDSLHEALAGDARAAMIMLMSAVGFVLLIACANVANLMLARASSRHRELSVRIALGATRGRIVRQLLTECVLVALLGGVLGVFIAYWGNDLILSSIPTELPYWMKFEIDGWILAFTALITVASGLAFGIAPALHVSRGSLFESLKDGGAHSGTGRGHHRMRNGLVVAEIALAMVLLAGAGLMIRSFLRMQEVGGTFDPEGVLAGRVTLPVARYPEDLQKTQFFAELLPRVRALPGVMAASAGGHLPLGRDASSLNVSTEAHIDDGPSQFPVLNHSIVLPGYFATLDIPIRAGRDFTPADGPRSPRVGIVNESAARILWPKEEPLGKRFKFGANDTAGWCTVVGVVPDVRQHIESQLIAQVYVPHAQDAVQSLYILVRANGDPTPLAAPIRALLQARDRDLPFYEVSTLRAAISLAVWEPRLYAWLMGAYSIIALAIAAVGIYGVMAYRVEQRTQEIGIRMALGAPQGAVLRMVVGQGMRLTVLGLGIGLAAAFAVTRLMAGMLFGVDPNDPPTFIGITVILALSAMLASWLPAWRASRVDPMTALRHE